MVLADGLVMECVYTVEKLWVEPKPFYHCRAKIIGDEQILRYVTELSDEWHKHLDGYTNLNVTAISFLDDEVRMAPRNIQAFFPNIEYYNLYLTFTDAIHPEDIARFPRLKYYLSQYNTKLTKIPPNMFKNNPNLVGIAFNKNSEIQHIADHVFDHLDELAYLDIDSPCIKLKIDNDRIAVKQSLSTLYQSCPP